MPRRPDECEASVLHRGDRTARGEGCGLPRGRARVRVRVQPGVDVDRLDRVDVRGVVDALDLRPRRPPPLDEAGEALVKPTQTRLRLGMGGVRGGMQARESRVADQIQPRASSNLRATPGTPSSLACAAAASKSGVTSGSAGSGASRSIAAMRR
jgi:hypothetical protein